MQKVFLMFIIFYNFSRGKSAKRFLYFTGLFFKRMMIKKNLLDFYILKGKQTENLK